MDQEQVGISLCFVPNGLPGTQGRRPTALRPNELIVPTNQSEAGCADLFTAWLAL